MRGAGRGCSEGSSMSDDRPSIAELQATYRVAIDDMADEVPWGNARDRILEATPVLHEIAAAALEWAETNSCNSNDAGDLALLNVIAKVRP